MATFTQIYYHIIFSTKNREQALNSGKRENLFRYINGIFKNNKCILYQINGTEDHLHILGDIHPTMALADLIKDVKIASSKWIKENKVFANFSHWQEGYGAFTHAHQDKNRLMNYIANQEVHHQKITFKEELRDLLDEAGIEFEEKYLL